MPINVLDLQISKLQWSKGACIINENISLQNFDIQYKLLFAYMYYAPCVQELTLDLKFTNTKFGH